MANATGASEKRFRVALSFPGEKRDFINKVADAISVILGKDRVLYDDYLTPELARPDLDLYLGQLYSGESELLVPFYCADYERKKWCKLEWRQMRDILFNVEGHRIMPFRFDDTPIDGVLSIDGYVKIGSRTPKDVADLILQRIGIAAPKPANQPQIAPSRLRHGAEQLFGREDELKRLDEAWNNPQIRIVTFVAFGGVGKTSLIVEWMNRLSIDGWRGAERIFDWTFYSQGTKDTVSSDVFFAKALEFFGDPEMAKSNLSPWDKGARLAQLVVQKRSLLVLDGVEPLQYPPGPMVGRLKDLAVEALLKGLARQNSGLCIITTRETVSDLAPFHGTTAPEWKLEHLSDDAGAALLEKRGVIGTLAECKQLSHDVNGHALTLNLMASYLVRAFGGDVRKRDQVKFEKADANVQGGHAFKAMAAYEKWLTSGGEEGQRQLAVLCVLGLFDHPASAELLAQLRTKPAIAHLTESLVGLSEEDWNITLTSLADSGLIFVHNNKTSVDGHPLIREYFSAKIRKKYLVGWRAAHRRIYKYLCVSTMEADQPTLEDLQPLYQAVAHGCQAGLQQEACNEVYYARILRGQEAYSKKKLGGFGSDLGAIAYFFEPPWSHVSSALTEADQAWLQNDTAYCLRALGRLTEALEPMRATMKINATKSDWENAAACANNLSELELVLGAVAQAVRDAERGVEYATRGGGAFGLMTSHMTLATALHQANQRSEAGTRFRQAEQMEAESHPAFPLLSSTAGSQYCDLLLTEVEPVAWQLLLNPNSAITNPKLIEFCWTVEHRAAKTIKIAERNTWLLDIALDHLMLGRATLYRAILGKTEIESLKTEIEQAVSGFRLAGNMDMLPLGLLSRSWLRCLAGPRIGPESAQSDLDEAWEIAERGPMKLHMADIHLYRARLFFREDEYPWNKNRDGTPRGPEDDLAAAEKLINDCGYHRRDEELANAKQAILGQ